MAKKKDWRDELGPQKEKKIKLDKKPYICPSCRKKPGEYYCPICDR